jgi:serine protease Do
VNTNGELIGINTAISSRTGSFSGYSFSIPVNLAKKILDDLKMYGIVKRGILGVGFFSPVDENRYLKEQGINPGTVKGVFITGIQEGSAAEEAGLKEADIIQSIDGIPIYSSGELSERIARHRPDDTIKLSYQRDGKEYAITARLKGNPSTDALREKPLQKILDRLGADFATLTPEQERRLNLRSGVLITEIYKGGFFEQLGIRAGTVISYVNGKEVKTPADIENALTSAPHARSQIVAIGPDGVTLAFNFSLGT